MINIYIIININYNFKQKQDIRNYSLYAAAMTEGFRFIFKIIICIYHIVLIIYEY